MTHLLDRLDQDHKHLVLLLDLYEKILDMFRDGQEPDYELLSELLQFMENYADQIHHPTEELIFDRLRAAGQHQGVLDVLTRQHEVLSQLTRFFRQSLDGVINSEVFRRDELEVQGRDLVTTLRNHLNLEEAEAFPLARQVLTDEDWAAIQAEVQEKISPIFDETDLARFRALYQHLSTQA